MMYCRMSPTHKSATAQTRSFFVLLVSEIFAALVTVRIDGSGLKDDVIITPTRIQLHRVPKECFIGQPNIDLNASTDIVQNGEFKETASYKWSRVANEATVEKYKEQFSNLSTHSGKHYFEGNSWNEGIETNYTDQDVAPLFLFENTHHEDFGAAETNQKYKRPAAAGPAPPGPQGIPC